MQIFFCLLFLAHFTHVMYLQFSSLVHFSQQSSALCALNLFIFILRPSTILLLTYFGWHAVAASVVIPGAEQTFASVPQAAMANLGIVNQIY